MGRLCLGDWVVVEVCREYLSVQAQVVARHYSSGVSHDGPVNNLSTMTQGTEGVDWSRGLGMQIYI